jgi:hypothetical protein
LYRFRKSVGNNLHDCSHGNAIVQLRYVARGFSGRGGGSFIG